MHVLITLPLFTVQSETLSFQELFVSNAGMKTVDKHALRGLHRLHRLSFSENYLRSAPPLTHACPSLKYLDLSFNDICEIPSSYFANCTHLLEISLRSNCLSEVPHLLLVSKTIHTVILMNNVITSAEALFENTQPFLSFLDLSFNLLSSWCFPPRSLWPNLDSIFLNDNNLSFMTEPFNYGRIIIRLERHNLPCSSHWKLMRQCKVSKKWSTPTLTCGDRDETTISDVSISCPGAQGDEKGLVKNIKARILMSIIKYWSLKLNISS